MYNILLLRELPDRNSKVRDYVQLSGYYVMEGDLNNLSECKDMLEKADLILLECNKVELYFGACEWLREMTHIPIIVLSECNDEWEKIKMFQVGADDYMVMPYSQAELIARIGAHIERLRRLTRPFGIIEVRDLQINAFNRQVLLRGKNVPMRLKEFDVLFYLAQMPNQVLSKEQIYNTVWKQELADTYFNTVAVHVKRIREKIEDDVDNPKYIETVWGIGYRFLG